MLRCHRRRRPGRERLAVGRHNGPSGLPPPVTDDRPGDAHDPIVGLSLEAAVEAVVARSDGRDPRAVRAALDAVAEDGVVTREGIESALTEGSENVATLETRVERAAAALAEARETAGPVVHLDVVRDRLDTFETRLAALESRVEDLSDDLGALGERADEGKVEAYEVATGVRRLVGETNAARRAADDLALDVGAFERWVESPDHRLRELEGDADAMAGLIDGLADATDDLAAAVEETDAAGGSDPGAPSPGALWLDATIRNRVLGLLLADLRATLADLRAWPDAEQDPECLDDLADCLDDLDARRDRLGARLDDLARPAWRDRHDDRLAAVERTIDSFEPPVDWADVQAALDDDRLGIGTHR